MSLRPTNFSRFSIGNCDPRDLEVFYADWITGSGPFGGDRRRRQGMGVPSNLTVEALVDDGDHADALGCVLRTRRLDRQWILHWSHRDSSSPDTWWHSIVRLTDDRNRGGGVLVEHLTGRVEPPNVPFVWTATPPKTVAHLMERYGRSIRPRDLFGSRVLRIAPSEVEAFATHVLLAEEREADLVVVSIPLRADRPLLDPAELARRLNGMATVAVLDGTDASWELTRQLDERELDQKLGCYAGAVRLYRPALRARPELPRHPLLLPVWLEQIPPRVREDRTAGRLVEILTQQVAPSSWLTLVDRIDAARHHDRIRVTLREMSRETATAGPSPTDQQLQERQARIDALTIEMAAAEELLREASQAQAAALEEAARARNERDELTDERDAALQRISSAFEVSSVEDALTVASNLFGERLIVLDSAWRAARRSIYRKPDEVLDVLMLLVLVASRKGEIGKSLHEVLGARARYKVKDSPETMTTFGEDRWFTGRDGERKEIQQHVTIGGSERADRHLQIYFDVLPRGTLEIAHVGEHLRTVSYDT